MGNCVEGPCPLVKLKINITRCINYKSQNKNQASFVSEENTLPHCTCRYCAPAMRTSSDLTWTDGLSRRRCSSISMSAVSVPSTVGTVRS